VTKTVHVQTGSGELGLANMQLTSARLVTYTSNCALSHRTCQIFHYHLSL